MIIGLENECVVFLSVAILNRFYFTTNAQKPPINDISSRARGLNFGLNFHLHPCFVHASRKGSGEHTGFRKTNFLSVKL